MQAVGGSAGDGMNFAAASVLFDGRAGLNSAVLMLFSTDLAVRAFRGNNFEPTSVNRTFSGVAIGRRPR